MEVLFTTKKLQKVCNSGEEIIRRYGQERGKRLQRRLAELAAAVSLAEVATLPQARLHSLSGDRAGQFAVDLQYPFRLILEPANEPVPRMAGGGVDLSRVTRVRIVEVVDYH